MKAAWRLAALALLTSAAAGAQQAAAPPDVPAGAASIRGVVLHRQRAEPVADVEVLLYALRASGVPGIRRGRSDAAGRFAFEGISADPDTAYLVGANFAGVPYPGARVRFDAGETLREVEVPVADVTPRSDGVRFDELRLRLDWRGTRLEVSETLVLRNDAAETIYVPAAERPGTAPVLETVLPASAGDLRLPLGVMPEGLVREDDALRYFGPLYNGPQELDWSYSLPSPVGRLELVKRLPRAPARVVVLAPATGPELRAPRLVAGEEIALAGQSYRRFSGEDFADGSQLELSLSVPLARNAPEAVSVAEARIVMEFDAAALRVSEEYALQVEGSTAVVAAPGSRLAHIPLPEGAQDIRFGTGSKGIGLEADPRGGLAVVGPVPPGESSVELAYQLPANPLPLRFSRAFSEAVPLVTLFVNDDGGLELSSTRLHRRRPVRSADRFYAQFEAFQVEAGESLELQLDRRPVRASLPSGGVLGLYALLMVGLASFLLRPLSTQAGEAQPLAEAPPDERESEALLAALRDLEHDHETQKVSDADYALLRDELRRRTAAQLQVERNADPLASSDPPVPLACPSCDRPAEAIHSFCAYCGASLGA